MIHQGRITLGHPPFSFETIRAKNRARKRAPAVRSPYVTLYSGFGQWERRNWAAGRPLSSMLTAALSAVDQLWHEVDSDSAFRDDPGPVDDFEELEPLAEAALRQLKRTLSLRRHSALVAQISKRERRHLRHLMDLRCLPPPRCQLDPDSDEPPGQVILASPHVTTGPPRLRVAALMRRTEAFS